MSYRYVVTARDDDVALPEEGFDVVATLDRGVLVDVEPERAEALASSGLRVKALPDPHHLNFFSYRIDTETGVLPDLPPEFSTPESERPAEGTGDHNHVVQLVGPAQESWLAAIEQRGVEVVEAVGPFGYLVRADAGTVTALRSLPFVAWTGRLEPAYKVNPVLLAPDTAAGSSGLGPIEALDVGVFTDGDVAGVAALIEESGGTVEHVAEPTSDTYRSITAQVPAEALAVLAARDDVRWVDAVRTPVPEDERSAQIAFEDLDGAAPPSTAPNVGYAANLATIGADGTGVTIAICDTGVDTNDPATVHADLAGRLAFAVTGPGGALVGGDTDGHGTHVAGIAAGNGASGATDPQGFALGLGMAPQALVGSVLANGTRQQRIQTTAQNGAHVMNNSYALDGSAYGAGDRTFDLGVRDADPTTTDINELVVVFSAGNSGPGATTCTKALKNAIVVGNSLNFRPGEGDGDDIRGLRASSSRGPAADNRQLPSLVAPGTDIVSARSGASARPQYTDTGGASHADHTRLSGTSMAAPAVAGTCAVLIDWWRRTRGGATPSPALLKALLCVSTESVSGGTDGNGGSIAAGPTNDAGWGRVSIENALLQAPDSDRGPKIFLDQRHAFTGTGQEYRIRVAAVDPGRPLRVALTWTDAAAAVGANPALVNDLDLEVLETGTASTFRGNNFAGAFSTPGGVADSLNNTEVVAIQNPSGVYEVTVVASSVGASARPDVATPWQDFALVLDNAEVPTSDPVSVVNVLDRSGSMQAFGYVDVTRQTSRQFIDLMSVDDSVGVVSFGDDGDQEFPPAGPPELIVGQATRDDAKAAVDGIAFGGCTFMGDGIATAGSMLAGAGTRTALVLLSDGFDNKGCDPGNPAKPSALQAAAALPANLPLYTCAMGPSSDQSLLDQLAANTDGRYYFMPTIDDLFEIYNYIRGQVTGDGIIVNESSMASRSTVSGFVDACAESVLFTVAWHDPELSYVSREPHGSKEISVRLRTPSGRWMPHSATEYTRVAGKGYLRMEVHDPQPGTWQVEVTTARREHTPYTVGGFVRSDISLDVAAPYRIGVGQPIDVGVTARDGKGVLDSFAVKGTVAGPRHRLDELVAMHKDRLRDVKIPEPLLRDGKPDKTQRLWTQLTLLRDAVVAQGGEDILAPSIQRIAFGTGTSGALTKRAWTSRSPLAKSLPQPVAGRTSAGPDLRSVGAIHRTLARGGLVDLRKVLRPLATGKVTGQVTATKVPGSYTLGLTASGFSAACGTRFVRKDLVSVLVQETADLQ